MAGVQGHLPQHHKRMSHSKEPYTYVWISLSSFYGRLIVILMLAFCLVEVMDNNVKLLTLQGVFLMYLYVGSIAVIMCIYIWVLIDSCASLQTSDGSQPPTLTTSIVADAELAGGMAHGGDPPSISRFGSLKRAHISRARTAYTSFYLRLGALAFGLGTLVFNGLEMAMHSMMEGACLNDVVFVHPVLHGLFTFLQMHFLFVNSQVLVERFGVAARFGFMHLAATNLALWVRLIVWESGNEWTYFVYLAQTGLQGSPTNIHSPSAALAREIPTVLQLRGFPKSMTMARAARDITFGVNLSAPARVYMPVSDNHIGQVVALHECLNTNSLGQLWTSSMPFLYPFIVQFSLIAAAVTFVMGQNVGRSGSMTGIVRSMNIGKSSTSTSSGTFTVDCSGASKGLFLGLLCLVAGIVVIIIFLVVKEDEDIPSETIFWLTFGALGSVLSICLIMTIIGLVQVRHLSVIGRRPTALDRLLSGITLTGVVLYSVFGILVGASGLWRGGLDARRHAMLLGVSVLQLVQSSSQSALIGETSRRAALTRHQLLTRPSRQVVTFLLFANAVLWAYDTFVIQSWVSQELQLRFFGVLAWGVISRIGLPLVVFYRFHSCVLLLEVWKCSYRLGFPGN